MADPALGQVTASVWEQVIGTKPSDNIFNSRALFYALGEQGFKEEVEGGRLIEFSLEYAENTTFRSYGELDTLDTTRVDVFDAARFDWKICAGTVVYSELERLRAQAASGKFDLIAEKLENGKDSHIADMNGQLWSDGTGNGGADIGGLQSIISATPTTGSVGGINRANFAFWRNKQTSGAKTTTAFDNLRSSLRSVYNQCSSGGTMNAPTAILFHRTEFEGLEGLMTSLERYNKDSTKQRGFNASFNNDAFMFKAATCFYDEDAVSGQAYLVNPKFLKFVYLKGGWMKMYDKVDPANQLSNVHKVATFGNLGTNNSRRLGVVTAIT